MTRILSRVSQARAEVAWTVIAFFALHTAFVLCVDYGQPGWCDAENELRLRMLEERTREHPDQPLLIVVGSSRIGAGFLPQELPTLHTADGLTVLPFNYSHLAAGPRMNLMLVHRLLREGITPAWIVMEIVPGSLVHERPPAEMAAGHDVAVLCRHAPWTKVLPVYWRSRLNPFYKHRQAALGHLAPPFVTRAARSDKITLLPLGDDDNWMRREDRTDEVRAGITAEARRIYFDRCQDFHIDPLMEGAIRELLELCRERRIAVSVLVAPENSQFRSWYSAETERRLGTYLEELRREHGVPVIDARTWVSDDGFNDPHHLRLKGAQVFTERLGREVLQPLVEGKLQRATAGSVIPTKSQPPS